MDTKKKNSLSGSIGFVLSAAGNAAGVGNIQRFPYLAAKDGGGLFLIIYLVLILTFGFTFLTTGAAIRRKTRQNALKVFGTINKKWNFLEYLTFLVPALIMAYYSVVGGWVTKYVVAYLTASGSEATQDGYFTSFITSKVSSVVFMPILLAAIAFTVYRGVEKEIEQFSRIIMPGLIFMIMGIAFFSPTPKYTDGNGVIRTGLQGLGVYIIPNLEGITLKRSLEILLDAMSQLFFSLSVSIGTMITYGSYVKKEVDLSHSLGQIEFFDAGVAFLAGLVIIPAVFVFSGTEGMAPGPSLMFVSLPEVFDAMEKAGSLIGLVLFTTVAFAALTSCISIMETLVANCMELFHRSHRQMSLIIGILFAGAVAIICMGYNVFCFEMPLPNGQTAQLLDLIDYISNSFLMSFISLLTYIFVGWIIKPSWINEEMEVNGNVSKRKRMYAFMIRYVTPVMMTVLFLQSTGISTVIRGRSG